ncbi:hypothetical protein P4V64_13790 [Bacillus thuringiensis]|nr:hypothetical protein [Bacillus thuringiensis]
MIKVTNLTFAYDGSYDNNFENASEKPLRACLFAFVELKENHF